MVNRGGLSTSHGHRLLGGADRSGAHTDSDAVGTAVDQAFALVFRHHVAGDHLQIGICSLDVAQQFYLEDGMPLGTVDDDDIHASLDQSRKPGAVIGACGYGGSNHQLFVRTLGGFGEVPVLFDVIAGNECAQESVFIDDGQFALLRFTKDAIRLLKGDSLGGRNRITGHHLIQFDGTIRFKIDITVGDDSDQF